MNYDYIILSVGFVIFAIALGLIIYYGIKDDDTTTNSGGGGGDTSNNDFWVALLNSSTAVTGVSSTYYSDSVTFSSTCWKAGTGLSFNYANEGNIISGFDTAFGSSSDGTSLWVAVGQATPSANRSIIWSNNGQSWQNSTGLSSGIISATQTVESRGVAYGLSSDKGTSLWVAVGGRDVNHSGMLFSLNGQSWHNCTGLSFIGTNLAYGGYTVAYGLSSDGETGIWVAGGHQGGTENNPTLLFSLDGQSWQNSTGASFHDPAAGGKGGDAICRGVAYGLSSDGETGIWCATGHRAAGDTKTTLFSLDGQSWQNSAGQQFKTVPPTPPDTSGGHAVAYGLSTNGKGIWVATGVGDTGANNILYSDDGQSWRNASGISFAGNGGRSVRFGTSSNGTSLWMAGGLNDGTETAILVSLNGVLWNEVSTPMTTNDNVKVEGLAYSKLLGPLSGNIQGLSTI